MSWLLAGAAAVGMLVVGPTVRRWWRERAKVDPRRDPVAAQIHADRKAALNDLLATPSADPQDTVEQALQICAVDEAFSWRAGLRRLEPELARLPHDDDGQALRAEVALQLGEVAAARALVAQARADHWRACGVRAGLYELDGDIERAESAWVAATLLAPPERREAPLARLRTLRRRHRRHPSPTQLLWERLP